MDGLIYDMEVRKDVKGGSPRSPPHGVRLDALEAEAESKSDFKVGSVWRVIAMCAATALLSGIATVLTLGLDNVKHTEIDGIMSTRAPYMHDKQRIEDHFSNLEKGQQAINARVDKLEAIARDDFDKRIRDLEQKENR